MIFSSQLTDAGDFFFAEARLGRRFYFSPALGDRVCRAAEMFRYAYALRRSRLAAAPDA